MNAITLDWHPTNQTAWKSVFRFSRRTRAKLVMTKRRKLKTTREWYFTHLPGRPHWGDRFEFWYAGHIADVITRANFVTIGLGVLEFWYPQFCRSP